MAEENKPKNPPYKVEFIDDSLTGLRGVTITFFWGFPDKYLGKWVLNEWTYGEKISVEMEAERLRMNKVNRLQFELEGKRKHPELEDEAAQLENHLRSIQTIDIPTLTGLQILKTIRESPIKLSLENLNNAPGRLINILANIVAALNTTPDAEKKNL